MNLFKGFSPRISPFVEPPDIGSLLQRIGYNIVTLVREISRKIIHFFYSSRILMKFI
jgi:hypothetical protein